MQLLNQVSNRNFFSRSIILTATTCLAHCVSSDFAMGKRLASTLAFCYPELQDLPKLSLNLSPLGSLVAYFDQQIIVFLDNLVPKSRFFYKPTYGTLELSLEVLNQHLKQHNIQQISIPNLGLVMISYTGQPFFECFSMFFRVQTSQLQNLTLYGSPACHYSRRRLFQLATTISGEKNFAKI